MNVNERRLNILRVLSERRCDTRENSAFEFNISKSTIERDILNLSLDYPIYTKQGFNGGIFVVDGFRLGKKYLTDKQVKGVNFLLKKLNGEIREIIESILREFSKPLA